MEHLGPTTGRIFFFAVFTLGDFIKSVEKIQVFESLGKRIQTLLKTYVQY